VGATAKVTRPRLTPLAPRPRLLRRIDELRNSHASPWIVAPAGSGKTALVASYIDRRSVPTLWYRVDEGDRHAEDLFFYLRLAAESFEKNRRAAVDLPVFSPGTDLAHFSRRFFEALFARLPAKAMLVFDDYHLACAESPWQTAMGKGLTCIPHGMSAMVLSRHAPPPALARLLVHGDIGVLETSELLLTRDETIALGKSWRTTAARPDGKRPTARPSRADLLDLHAATGGWPAGVSLLLRRRNRTDDIARLGAVADVQPIFDYLASDVFADLPGKAQRILLHTACLPRFTAEQAGALSGVRDARVVLAALFRSGFFLERDGADTQAFRCHALFRSFLYDRGARVFSPAEQKANRLHAARLLRDGGQDEEAFQLLLAVGERDALGDLLVEAAPALIADGRVVRLQRLLSELPAKLVGERSWLIYWQSFCTLMTAPLESRVGFERALESFLRDGDGAGAYLAWAGAVQAVTYEGRSWSTATDWLGRLGEIERRFPAFPSADVGLQVASSLLMALTLAAAEPATVEEWATRALALADNASDPNVRIITASVLVLGYALRGDSGHAAALVETLGRESLRGDAGSVTLVAANAATAALTWNQGDSRASLAACREGLRLMGDGGVPMWHSALLVFGAFAALDLGDAAATRHFLGRLAAIARSGTPLEIAAYHVIRAHQALARGDLATAMVAIELSLDRDRAVGFSYGYGKDLQVLAYIAFERGDTARASDALAEARRMEHRDPLLPFWRLLIEADRALQERDRARAVELVRAAFAIGRERQVFGVSLPPPERLAELGRLALEEGVEVEYARTLIQRRQLGTKSPALNLMDWPWPIRVYTLRRIAIVEGSGLQPRSASTRPNGAGTNVVAANANAAVAPGAEAPADGVTAPSSLGRSRMLPLMLKAIVALGAGGRGVSTSQIQAVLWPDADGDAATQVFEVTLLRLRKQLGPAGHQAIRLDRGRVWLNRSICWSDADALEALLGEIGALDGGGSTAGAGARAKPDRATVKRLFERLVTLWPGPFAGPGELPATLVVVDDRLRSRAARAALSLCQWLEELGDDEGAAWSYARSIEAAPATATEALLVPAVRCLLRRGRRREAQALLELCRVETSRDLESPDDGEERGREHGGGNHERGRDSRDGGACAEADSLLRANPAGVSGRRAGRPPGAVGTL